MSEQNQNQQPAQNLFAGLTVPVNPNSFGAKYQSKREVYRFLSHDCGAYLSSYETMTIYHLRDLMSGVRKRIKAVDVKVIQVPHFKGLKVSEMFDWAAERPEVMIAFPETLREREDLPRGYVANVINTIEPIEFPKWVNRIVNIRHQKRQQKLDTIQMDPEIHRIYDASTAVAVVKGNSHNLLKKGAKRRRTAAEIEEAKLEEERQQQRIRDLTARMDRFERMERELTILQQRQDEMDMASNALQALKEHGLIKVNQEGDHDPVESWEEHQQLLLQRQQEFEEARLLAQQNKQLQQHQAHQSRRRAGNQLEAIQDFNSNRSQLAGQTVLMNSGLSESMVIINGAGQIHQQMQEEDGQIPSSIGPQGQQQQKQQVSDSPQVDMDSQNGFNI